MKAATAYFFVLLFVTNLHAQQPLTNNQQTVQQTIAGMFEALSNRDSVSLKLYCAPDITLYEYGLSWNIDTLINKTITLNTAVDFKRLNTFDFINTSVDNNTAWACYRLQSAITANGKHRLVEWIETVILVRKNKKWAIKVLHSTRTKVT